jgi:hypothetical protein
MCHWRLPIAYHLTLLSLFANINNNNNNNNIRRSSTTCKPATIATTERLPSLVSKAMQGVFASLRELERNLGLSGKTVRLWCGRQNRGCGNGRAQRRRQWSECKRSRRGSARDWTIMAFAIETRS